MSVSRRKFMRVGLGALPVISFAGSLPSFLGQFASAQTRPTTRASDAASNDNILVVVQLSGGNDGLNTVVPVRDDLYYKARQQIGLKDKLHKLNDDLSLNSGMGSFKELFDAGQLAVINGCGYPKPNRSHFESMAIWQTADPAQKSRSTGWLGHYIDHCLRGTEGPLSKAVYIGSELPQALVTEGAPVPSIQSVEDFSILTNERNKPEDQQAEKQIIADLNAAKDASPALKFLSRQATNALLAADQLRKLSSGYKPNVDYNSGLGKQLELIARIIGGNFGTRLFYCQAGGFDTHANQLQSHNNTLGDVAKSIASFHTDLAKRGVGDKVTVMCFSEFGRRVNENTSRGTDHGAAGPMFVSGAAVKGGIYGAYPSLKDLDDGDLKYTTDFRRVYATLLDKWLNVKHSEVLGNTFETVAFL